MDELRDLCYSMGYFLTEKQLEWARTFIDKDGSGQISYDEFSVWWQNPLRFEHLLLSDAQLEKLHEIVDLFRSFDRFNQGFIEKNQFEKLFRQLIEKKILEESQAKQFDEIDRSKDGQINFNELIAWFYEQGILKKIGILSDTSTE